MDSAVLFNVFVFLAAMCIMVPLASRFKLGAVLGYLAAGILIGPFGFGLIGNAEQIMHFAEFGVVMMLFVIGLELEPSMLWRMRSSIMGLGSAQVVITSAVFAAIGITLGFSWQTSLAIGMALSLSSTALVLQILQEKNLMQTRLGETSFAVLLFQDIAVIPILIIIPLLAGADAAAPTADAGFIASLSGWAHALVVALAIGAVILLGRLSHRMFLMVARTNLREIFTATSLAVVVGITLLMQTLGMSPALGAFIAGLVLANSEYKHTLETDIEPFKGLLLGLFFISVGMGMDFELMYEQPMHLAVAVGTLIAVKLGILALLARACKLEWMQTIGFAFVLSQGGEFAFVLFRYAQGLAVIPTNAADFGMLAVAISMALTPLLMLFFSRSIQPRFMSMLPQRDFDDIHEQHEVIIAGFGRFGQIVGRFLMAQGVAITVLDKDPDQIETLRKFNFKGYFGDATRLDMLRSAGAAKAKLLVVAIDDADECLEIVERARKNFPNLTVFARARNRRHAYELHKAGAHYFKRELFDSSLSMSVEAMVMLGRRESDMQYKATQFLHHDEDALRKSFAFFDDEPELVNFTQLQRQELERILSGDISEKN